ncbi:MAG: nucleoside phosphorylase [Epulopiscium sp.]|nr:nucleoside phosphorylase [Candidatus Epulonipiscium sp.]
MNTKSLYLRASKEEISKYVVFSGDPLRVGKIITLLEDVEQIAVSREYHTYTGMYKGVKVTISSTGIGGPSAAIAMEEMYDCGMEVAIRLGTVMGLKDNLGKYIIPKAVMREESTSKVYVDASYPAVADFELLQCMNESVVKNKAEYDNGIMCTLDGYYSDMKESRLSKQMGTDVLGKIASYHKYNIVGLDMESGVILTLANLMGIKGCVVTLTTVLENLVKFMEAEERANAEELLARIVLDGIVIYDQKQKES